MTCKYEDGFVQHPMESRKISDICEDRRIGALSAANENVMWNENLEDGKHLLLDFLKILRLDGNTIEKLCINCIIGACDVASDFFWVQKMPYTKQTNTRTICPHKLQEQQNQRRQQNRR